MAYQRYVVSFYDLKLRKNAMALLSKVTVVVKPSPQLETPAPMTGDPLQVYAADDFIDPPDTVNGAAVVYFNIYNPQKFLPFPETNDNSPPPTIFRSLDYHKKEERSNRRVIRVVKPSSLATTSDVILYEGTTGAQDLTMPQGTGGGVGAAIPNVINGLADYISNDFLPFDYGSATSLWYNYATYELENELQMELEGIGPVKVAHCWVMCGKAYLMTNEGQILSSSDGFSGDITEFSAITARAGEEAYDIKRNHPGILLASNVSNTI